MQLNNNLERFYSFFPFLELNNLLPLTGMKYFDPRAFRVRAEKNLFARPVYSKLVVKTVFSSVMYSSY